MNTNLENKKFNRVQIAIGVTTLLVLMILATIRSTRTVDVLIAVVSLMMLLTAYLLRDQQSAHPYRSIRFTVIGISLFLSLRYLFWRATETLPLQYGPLDIACGVILLMTECYCFLISALGYLTNINPINRVSIPLPADENLLPHVDVYIPTYDEDLHILSPTLIAASQLRYPKDKLHVYVLDDGGTQQKCKNADPIKAAAAVRRAAELKAIAKQFGATYLTRERNVRAKAGNINNALSKTSGDLIAVFDCDHVPSADFLEKTVGFFLADSKLFLVQTPHNLINADPLERNLSRFDRSPGENELFYGAYKQGLDSWGATFFCGSAALLSRKVLMSIGGFATQTVTEDAETTLEALKNGYSTLYYNHAMISGLQPETFSSFIQQRVRWAQGMIQIFLLKNPWLQPRLTFIQRVLFTNLALTWFFPVQRLIMLLTPPAVLLFSITVADAKVEDMLIFILPSVLGSLLTSQYLYGQLRWPFTSILYEVLQSMHLSAGIFQVLRRPRAPQFQVTPKGELLEKDFISTLAKPFYLLLLITAAAIINGVFRYLYDQGNQSVILFITIWAAGDLVLLLCALGITFEKRQRRIEPRTAVNTPIILHSEDMPSIQGTMVDASASGAKINLICLPKDISDLRLQKNIRMELPKRGITLGCDLQSVSSASATSASIGVAYRLLSTADDRSAVDIAFGSSDQLEKNLYRRHKGQSLFNGLKSLGYYAIFPGLGHLKFLALSFFRRLRIVKKINYKEKIMTAIKIPYAFLLGAIPFKKPLKQIIISKRRSAFNKLFFMHIAFGVAMMSASWDSKAQLSVAFTGVQAAATSTYAYAGLIKPFENAELGKGWYKKVLISHSNYHYQKTITGTGTEITANIPGIEAGAGHAWKYEKWTLDLSATVGYRHIRLSPVTPAGDQHGGIVTLTPQIQSRVELTSVFDADLIANYALGQHGSYARVRFGWKPTQTWRAGIELAQIDGRTYHTNQRGLFASLPLPKNYSVELSAGRTNPQDSAASNYAGLAVSKVF